MMCLTPTHSMQQDLCRLMSEVDQLTRQKNAFAGMIKQLQKDLSAKVSV